MGVSRRSDKSINGKSMHSQVMNVMNVKVTIYVSSYKQFQWKSLLCDEFTILSICILGNINDNNCIYG